MGNSLLICFPMNSKHLESTSLKFILLRCRALQLLPAKIINVCELLCLTFGPQFVEQVFLRQWLREHLPCASGAASQHEQRELPSPLTLQAVSHYPHTVLPSYLAETSILALFIIMGRGENAPSQGVKDTNYGSGIDSLYVLATISLCMTSESIVCNYPRLENLKAISSSEVHWNSHFQLSYCWILS